MVPSTCCPINKGSTTGNTGDVSITIKSKRLRSSRSISPVMFWPSARGAQKHRPSRIDGLRKRAMRFAHVRRILTARITGRRIRNYSDQGHPQAVHNFVRCVNSVSTELYKGNRQANHRQRPQRRNTDESDEALLVGEP